VDNLDTNWFSNVVPKEMGNVDTTLFWKEMGNGFPRLFRIARNKDQRVAEMRFW